MFIFCSVHPDLCECYLTDPLVDFEGLHDNEESDGEYMPQNETIAMTPMMRVNVIGQ